MHDDKGIAVLTAEPEGCKMREIPPLQRISHIQTSLAMPQAAPLL